MRVVLYSALWPPVWLPWLLPTGVAIEGIRAEEETEGSREDRGLKRGHRALEGDSGVATGQSLGP
jgi:hypothetical protein